MKTLKLGLLSVVVAAGFGLTSQTALAATPTLTATLEGNSLRLNVQYGDPYSAITLYSRQGTSLWTVSNNIGNTDGAGYFNGLVNPGINPNGTSVEAYVMINGRQSNVSTTNIGSGGTGCYYSGCYNGTLQASQTSVTLNGGQSSTIYFYPNGGQGIYIASNPNPSLISTTISGNSLTLYANGSTDYSSQTILRICSSYGNQCADITVMVNGFGGGYGKIWLSQTNLTVTRGQTSNVQITANGANNFYISSNSNANIANAWVSGTTLYVNGLSSGYTTIIVCATPYATTNNSFYGTNCASLYVTVNDNGSYNQIWLSPTSLTLNANQNGTVVINSNNSSDVFAVVNNTNYGVASFTLSGHTLTVYGYNSGSTTMTICRTSYDDGRCAKLVVTVNGYTGNALYFQTTTLPQAISGQFYSQQLQVSGGTWPYNFGIVSGSLPAGLTLSSSGMISGTVYTSNYSSTFTIRAWDNNGRSVTQQFTLVVGQVNGVGTYRNGALIAENGTIYQVYKNRKSGFANWDAFVGLGYRLENVVPTYASGLPDSGYLIQSRFMAHPFGTWVLMGGTVEMVTEQGLIPVPSYDIFLNNGGQVRWIVPANYYDYSLPMLPLMQYNDYRLN